VLTENEDIELSYGSKEINIMNTLIKISAHDGIVWRPE
jgi:hypothetical protein